MPAEKLAVPETFVMIASPNDVSGKRAEAYFLVPIAAREAAPGFWGWPSEFKRKGGRRVRKVTVEYNGDVHKSRIYLLEPKSEFRFCSEVHNHPEAGPGWVLEVSRRTEADRYKVSIHHPDSQRAQLLAGWATHAVANSDKRWGFTAPVHPGSSRQVAEAASDYPSETDLLGFAPWVNALADVILSPQTSPPLAASVEGPWGAGKSSFLRQLRKELKTRRNSTGCFLCASPPHPKIVEFSPWRYTSAEELWAGLAEAIVRQARPGGIRGVLADADLWWRRLDWRQVLTVGVAYARVLFSAFAVGLFVASLSAAPQFFKAVLSSSGKTVRKDVAGAFGAIAMDASSPQTLFVATLAVLFLWARFKPMLPSPKLPGRDDLKAGPDHQSRLSFFHRLIDDFPTFLKSYRAPSVIILVDDLDRAEAEVVATLIQAMSLMLGSSRSGSTEEPWKPLPIYFVLAMDREKVAAAVAASRRVVLPFLQEARTNRMRRDGSDEEFGMRFGRLFVEKLVQLPIRLPRLNEKDWDRFGASLTRVAPGAEMSDGQKDSIEPTVVALEDSGDLEQSGSSATARLSSTVLEAYDIPGVADVLRVVAAEGTWTPRRVKVYFNRLRYLVVVAQRTGLLRPLGSDSTTGVTAVQIGKALAVVMEGDSAAFPKLVDWKCEVSEVDYSIEGRNVAELRHLLGIVGA